jgi:HK97 family phage portal protein
LEPEFVTVLVADSGDVYYQIKRDDLSQAKDATVPASEIIHDRGVTLYHPLVGVTPIYACGMAATMGNAIQSTGAAFFKNKATPGGILSAPGRISDDTAARLKESWQNNHAGSKAGGIAVLGDGLKFERMTMTATDAQLVEQLRFSVEDVARCYRYPLFKLQSGAPIMAGSAEELNLQYYGDALQPLIESMESVLNAGLELPSTMHIELDISGLGRMNSEAQTRTLVDGVKGGILTRNEARARLNQQPKEGGDELMAQQQDYTLPDLAALRERERVAAVQQPVQAAPAASEESEEPDPEEETKAIIARFRKGLLA